LAEPRDLTPRESEILDFLLSIDDARLDPLREQRRTVKVTGGCGCGCATIDLAVDRERSGPADICGQPVSAVLTPEAEPSDPRDHVGLLLFLEDGWLSQVEIWWIQNPAPEFPPASSFAAPRLEC
jgi:hypothetical protein